MPKISVIIPVYNVEPYLRKCLDSVINQTLKDIEIICVNDCSTDNSLSILKEYAQKDKRFVIIDFEEKKNVSFARNAGIRASQGEYLSFIDSDDWVDRDFCEILYKRAIENSADIVKGNCYTIIDNKFYQSTLNKLIKIKGKFFFFEEWWSAIYNANFIKNNEIYFKEDIPKGQDVVFLNECILRTDNIVLEDSVYYYYFKHADSLHRKNLSKEHFLSANNAIIYILKDINTFLFNKDILLYVKYFCSFLTQFFNIAYLNEEPSFKYISAQYIINGYNLCKDKTLFDKYFSLKNVLNLIKNNDVNALAEKISLSKSYQALLVQNLKSRILKGEASDK